MENVQQAPVPVENVESSQIEETNLENQEAEGQEVAETPAEEKKEPSKAEKKKTKKLKLKVYGKEVEEDLPFEIEESPEALEYLTKNLQLSKAASKKQQEYAQLEKEVAHFLKELKANPRKVLSDPNIGIDVKQLAASIIEEEIANSQKTPEQIKAEQLEAELQRIKDEREREKEELKQKELERLQQQEYERYDLLMTKALEKTDLPKSPYIVKKMADYMLLGLQNNIDVTPDDVVPLVREEMINDLKEMFAVMPEEVIEGIIGKDTINKLRKKRVAQVKAGAPTLPNKQILDTAKKQEPEGKEKDKKLTFKDFFGM